MTIDKLVQANQLKDKISRYCINLNTFENKNKHESDRERVAYNQGRRRGGWFFERCKREKKNDKDCMCALSTAYEGGGIEFIGFVYLDEEDIEVLHRHLKEKYERLQKEFDELT